MALPNRAILNPFGRRMTTSKRSTDAEFASWRNGGACACPEAGGARGVVVGLTLMAEARLAGIETSAQSEVSRNASEPTASRRNATG